MSTKLLMQYVIGLSDLISRWHHCDSSNSPGMAMSRT